VEDLNIRICKLNLVGLFENNCLRNLQHIICVFRQNVTSNLKTNLSFTNQILVRNKDSLKQYLPTDACRNLGPILESRPMPLATSLTSAPVASHITDIELMLEIRCARNALAACEHDPFW